MKLRLLGNVVRLRLTRSEVERVGAGEPVVEHVPLAPAGMSYCLQSGAKASVRFAGDVLEITLPEGEVREWAAGERVGITAQVAGAGGARMELVVEKDFKCLHREDASMADDADSYPNPAAEDRGGGRV